MGAQKQKRKASCRYRAKAEIGGSWENWRRRQSSSRVPGVNYKQMARVHALPPVAAGKKRSAVSSFLCLEPLGYLSLDAFLLRWGCGNRLLLRKHLRFWREHRRDGFRGILNLVEQPLFQQKTRIRGALIDGNMDKRGRHEALAPERIVELGELHLRGDDEHMKLSISCVQQCGADEALHVADGALRGEDALDGHAVGEQEADEDLTEAAHALGRVGVAHFARHHGAVRQAVHVGRDGLGRVPQLVCRRLVEVVRQLDLARVEPRRRRPEHAHRVALQDLARLLLRRQRGRRRRRRRRRRDIGGCGVCGCGVGACCVGRRGVSWRLPRRRGCGVRGCGVG
ncbi:unnamed protein product [Chondrus crispus]|uniref:Uncharacterized protein n=1 Tax=Chondrus crispus TaxID=2769 RepID=R7QM44_CHOCR|nr:unnamed protein product [Chondrus crispus]CDF38455.1 unnamed protein product [Chondrus crispus]|eukprot:XP_005718348.1 unnamed protein product [Chondrus crispus]